MAGTCTFPETTHTHPMEGGITKGDGGKGGGGIGALKNGG